MSELRAGVRELQARLSKYLRPIGAGPTIAITERGKTIRRIIPGHGSLKCKVEAMRRAGLIRWSGRRLKRMKPVAQTGAGRSVSRLIAGDRR